ncbi:FAD-binding oxidoreductase [Kutzneria buriramensis]|uniref:Glycine/D-amino acid oxidase-like deaminating enzyme n=1 Tax=Kutzneria buriramensis TaxID=1045776 RepID=A0A3E0HIX4_9PSEU|nr:FAD-dependent oxidoreductase [Kutzneria buriramensis]REH46015.1 glycine/D-amino acid oxidase-like deaminating enzyme [Kutzneria buriramensis]
MAGVLIVGAGVVGLVTAIECVLAGHRVTVLERGDIPNPESTSFDQHRGIRMLDVNDPVATWRMLGASRRWRELESLLDTRFYRRVGMVTAWPLVDVASVTKAASSAGVSLEPVDVPHMTIPQGTVALSETDGGVLLAERFLRAATDWLSRQPAVTLKRRSPVRSVHSGLGADIVLVAAGPWSRNLVDYPVRLYRQAMVYLRPPANLARWWENAPAAGRIGPDGRAWLLPPGDGTLLKISTDAACQEVDEIEATTSQALVDKVLGAGMVPDVDRYTVVAAGQCHYADANGPVLAEVAPRVWARVACGGTGFATAPLVANQIVELLREEAA